MKDVIKSQQNNEEYKLINGQRVKVNRRQRRSNLNSYYALAVVFVAIIVLILCMTVFFNVKSINISGATLYSKEQIMAVGGVSGGGNLIRTNTDVIEKRLSDNLAYVDAVTVSKKYPSSLEIKITEAVQAAELQEKDGYYLVSESGKILEKNSERKNPKLPLVKGFQLKDPKVNGEMVSKDSFKTDILSQMMEEIDALSFENINVIDLTERTNIVLEYDNRIEIRLGSSVDMDYKLTSIKATIDEYLAEGYEGILRYNGVSSGISAIPKKTDDQSSAADSTASDESSDSSADSSVPADTTITESSESSDESYSDWDSTDYSDSTYADDTADSGSYSDWSAYDDTQSAADTWTNDQTDQTWDTAQDYWDDQTTDTQW